MRSERWSSSLPGCVRRCPSPRSVSTDHLSRVSITADRPLSLMISLAPSSRLRSQRMTIAEANDLLDEQIVEIQTLADEVDTKGAMVDETKRELGKLVKIVRDRPSAA